MLAEPVAGILRSIEQTRDALDEMMQVAASASNGTIPDELPKPAGMPMLDVNEISKKIVIKKIEEINIKISEINVEQDCCAKEKI